MSVYGDYAARGRTAWWLYPLAVVLALGFSAAILVVLFVPMFLMHLVPPTLADDLVRPTHPVVFFLGTGAEFGIVLLGFIGAIALVHGKRFGDIVGRWSWRLALLGAGVWLAVQMVGAFVDFALFPHSFRFTATSGTRALALAAVVGLGVQTFAEEFVFRGYLTQALLLAVKRPWLAATISGLLFGGLHWANGPAQAVNAVFVGIAAAIIAIRTGSIAFTFGLHLVNNVFGAVCVVSSADVFHGSPGLFTQTAPQLIGWDVVFAVVALLAVLWFTSRLDPPGGSAPGGDAS